MDGVWGRLELGAKSVSTGMARGRSQGTPLLGREAGTTTSGDYEVLVGGAGCGHRDESRGSYVGAARREKEHVAHQRCTCLDSA